jgi:hypothetical protein
MTTPTQQLRSIRLVIVGDIRPWMTKVADLITRGADPKVLDDWRGEGSIISFLLYSGMCTAKLDVVVPFLLAQGVTASPSLFINCLYRYEHFAYAEMVVAASIPAFDVNDLVIDDVPIHNWVLKHFARFPATVKFLKSKGLRVDQPMFSINDIIKSRSEERPM